MKTLTRVSITLFFALVLLFVGNEVLYRIDLLAQGILANCCEHQQCNNTPCTHASGMSLHTNHCVDSTYTCRECINAGRNGDLCAEPVADDYCLESDGVTKYLVCPYLSASISGPAQLCVLDVGTYTISASGGTPSFSYAWYEKDGGGAWYYKGSGTSVQAGDWHDDFYIKCVVTDACEAQGGPRTVTPQRFIDYIPCKKAVSDEEQLDLSIYPNPFNPTGRIMVTLPEPQSVSLVIYNMQGQEVRRLLLHQEMSAGRHILTWDTRNSTGGQVASGIYLCRLVCPDVSKTVRLLLMR